MGSVSPLLSARVHCILHITTTQSQNAAQATLATMGSINNQSPEHASKLPQLTSDTPFLSEGGLETSLVFTHNIALTHFASFLLLEKPETYRLLIDIHIPYVELAIKYGTGIVIETSTWRCSAPWVRKILGLEDEKAVDAAVRKFNQLAVALLQELRSMYSTASPSIVICGSLGPLSDAYQLSDMDAAESEENAVRTAKDGFRSQVGALKDAGVDMLSLMTTNSVSEAIAACEVAKEAGLKICVSWCLETDGKLLSGRTLQDVIREVDEKMTEDGRPLYHGINCAHPKHFVEMLQGMDQESRERIGSIRANASTKSHDELDGCDTLDRGDIAELAECCGSLRALLPALKVVGGCCGTDQVHVEAIARKVLGQKQE